MSELVYECSGCDRRIRRFGDNTPEKDCVDCGRTTWEMVPQ